jgi:dTDP-4-dehydrorhamnose reductase
MRMRILVTGAGGQLGRALLDAARPDGCAIEGMDRARLDVTDRAAVRRAVLGGGYRVVINAAAYTAVDKAETDERAAFAANADAAAHVAGACAEAGIPLLHVSTDYVFDGGKRSPYVEDDPVAPLGVYGASKAEGEARVRALLPRHVILRTSWLYGAHGHNFVRTMLRLGRERSELRVVDDQRGTPTSAADLAAALLRIAVAVTADGERRWGTYHFSGAGATSWHGFAEEVFRLQAAATGRRPRVVPIPTAEYPLPARRPANSVLDCGRVGRAFGLVARPWQDALAGVVATLLREQAEERQ